MVRIEDSDLTIQELVLRKGDDEWDERFEAQIGRIADEMGFFLRDIVLNQMTCPTKPPTSASLANGPFLE
jgi:hypothetical protein